MGVLYGIHNSGNRKQFYSAVVCYILFDVRHPYGKTLLITLNFIIQLCIDAISTKLIDKIGYRTSAIIAHVCAGGGLILLSFLPELTPDPFVGILISVFVYALGGGLIEVLISPIVEACPTENKEKAMSLLHSFYCWGHVGVVLVSTAFFALFGIEKWRVLAILWAIIPVFNVFLFSVVPIYTLGGENRKSTPLKKLFASGTFWLFMLMMVCAGAGEQAVSQWASAFAETGLNVSKTLGDLLGPMMFAFTMGLSRLIFGKFGEKMKLDVFMIISTCLCLCSYMLISLVNNAAVGLMGCALCGFSVGILWPGTFSQGAERTVRRQTKCRGEGLLCLRFSRLPAMSAVRQDPRLPGLCRAHAATTLKKAFCPR